MKFIYKIERIERSTAIVELEVLEHELDATSHQTLEERAVAKHYSRRVVEWGSCETAHRADLLERRKD